MRMSAPLLGNGRVPRASQSLFKKAEPPTRRSLPRTAIDSFRSIPLTTAGERPVQRKCAERGEANQAALFRKESDPASATAPAIVDEALAGSGTALDYVSRTFFEPRFGYDFSKVRIHTDDVAARSAQAVHAKAYTVGRDIVFAPGEFNPSSSFGQQLIAHELTHVVQQAGATSGLLRRSPCFTGGACNIEIPGDPGRFGEKAAATEAANRPPTGPCTEPGHKDPAPNVLALVKQSSVTVPPEVHGIFTNACLPDEASAKNSLCRSFPDGPPAGAPPDKSCIQVHRGEDDLAQAIIEKPPESRTEEDNSIALSIVSVIAHESQHAHFNPRARAIAGTASDCNINTVMFHGPHAGDVTIKNYLSEMSAEIAEFAPFFQAVKSNPTKERQDALLHRELSIAEHKDESISGILWALKCRCSCSTADAFTVNVFNETTKPWPDDQREEFQKAMTRFIEYWPEALKIKPDK